MSAQSLRRKPNYLSNRARWAASAIGVAAGGATSPAGADPLPLAYITHASGAVAQPMFLFGWSLIALTLGLCVVIALPLAFTLRQSSPRPKRSRWTIMATGSVLSTTLLFASLLGTLRAFDMAAAPEETTAAKIIVAR